jgi:hypothetical protein
MFNRCTNIYIDKSSLSAQWSNRLVEPNKDAGFINLPYHDLASFNQYPSQHDNDTDSNQYLDKGIYPYGISVIFPTSIWGFSLLLTPTDAGSFWVLKTNIFIKQTTTRL